MSDKLWMWIAWKMPKKLVYFCTVRAGAHATTGEHSSQVVPELEFIETLKRWSKTYWGWT